MLVGGRCSRGWSMLTKCPFSRFEKAQIPVKFTKHLIFMCTICLPGMAFMAF